VKYKKNLIGKKYIMISELVTKIKEGLEALQFEDTKPCFVTVEDTFTLTPTWYPYAVFEIDQIWGTREDSCNNNRKYTFKIQVYRAFEWLKGTEQEKRTIAREKIANIVDRLIFLYDKNEFLDWIVDNSEIVNFQFWTYSKADWKDWAWYMVQADLVLDKLYFIK